MLLIALVAYAVHEFDDRDKFMDIEAYYYTGKVLFTGQDINDYNIKLNFIREFGGLPYALHVKLVFKLMSLFPYKVVLSIWIALKILLIMFILGYVYREMVPEKRQIEFIVFSMLLFSTPFLSDLGNMTVFIYSAFIMAFISFKKEQWNSFIMWVVICASVKYSPLLLLVLLPRRKYTAGAVTVVIFIGVLMLEKIFYPQQFSVIGNGVEVYLQNGFLHVILTFLFLSAFLLLKNRLVEEKRYTDIFILMSFMMLSAQMYRAIYHFVWIAPAVGVLLCTSLNRRMALAFVAFAILAAHGAIHLQNPIYILFYFISAVVLFEYGREIYELRKGKVSGIHGK